MSSIIVKQKPIKILLVGLDNCGKTSIILSLRESTSVKSLDSPKPTLGVNIENFEYKNQVISLWECGGTETYRNKYLENFHKYFGMTDKLLFIVDVQDRIRYDLALDYLEKIIKLLEKERKSPTLSILLHKYDPNITEQQEFKNLHKDLNLTVIKQIRKIIPSNINYTILKTSIYTDLKEVIFDI